MAVVASIAICTRDRARTLGETLASLERTELPAAIPAEVVIVDNGSADGTAELVAAWRPHGLVSRYVREPRAGVAHARNTALATATGRVVVFLDDDVRPPASWLEPMCRPVLSGATDAVAGGVRIAPHLRRAWMEPLHRTWLASTEYIDPRAPAEMVSANMAVGAHVLHKVPRFDPELGPGALGQGEDALFSWQLIRAGFRIHAAFDVAVDHHFDPSRLDRPAFRDAAERRGRTLAYQRHHWEHVTVPDPGLRLARACVRLAIERARHRRANRSTEGMPVWEMLGLERIAFLRAWRIESRRPRSYDRFGLVKRVPG